MLNVSSKERVPWGPLAGILFSFVGFFVAQVAAFMVVTLVVQGLGIQIEGDLLDAPAAQFSLVLLSDILIVAALWFFLRARGTSFRPLGFGCSVAWRDVLYALVGYGAYFGMLIAVLVVAAAVSGVDLDQRQELGFDTIVSMPEKWMAFASLVLLPPVVEEMVFRGFLYTGLRKKLPFLWATVVTSLLFGGLHLLGVTEGVIWVAALDTFVLSLVLCYLREKTGALWAPIMLHMGKNAIAFVLFLGVVASK